MHLAGIGPFLLVLVAFILSMLCLFAGSNPSFLQSVDVMTLNVSMIGETPVFDTSDGDGGFFDDLENDVQDTINDKADDVADYITDEIGIHDFYSVHLMTYCEGFYEPNGLVQPDGSSPSENVTGCSNRTTMFHFNPKKVLQSELKDGVTLDDLKWPDDINDGIIVLEAASKTMFVFYVAGIAITGLALITTFAAIFMNGRITILLGFSLSAFAFILLGIASAIATVISVKTVEAVNKYGDDIGVSATRGQKFLGMTWAAVAAMLIATLLSIVLCVVARRRNHAFGPK
ncbi:hypothetical protein FQN54_002911 [Arachnomyces sp. PD_36]|nr:hypothetical protein FQN54_002911 [Arachnomyces sp. PD_36]